MNGIELLRIKTFVNRFCDLIYNLKENVMEKIIITTPDELKALVKEAVHGLLPAPAEQKNDTDAANLVEILAFLKENGYPTSRGKMYKLTSAGDIPHRMYNGKLVFSRKEVLKWAASQTRNRHDYSEITRTVARSARRKMK